MNSLEFAIKMELDGEKYYLDQAENNTSNSVKKVCQILAREEHKHANLIQRELDELGYDLLDTNTYENIKNVFTDLNDFKSEIKDIPTQLEFYHAALEIEKNSIDLYTNFYDNAVEVKGKALYEFLVKQEKKHFAIIDAIITMLRHADEWVESAEFGLRIEEY